MPLANDLGSPPSNAATNRTDPRGEKRLYSQGNSIQIRVPNRNPPVDSTCSSSPSRDPNHQSSAKPFPGHVMTQPQPVQAHEYLMGMAPGMTPYQYMGYGAAPGYMPVPVASGPVSPSPSQWTMAQIEEFFCSRGFEEEVDFIRQAEFDTQQAVLFSGGAITPVQVFSLKLGLKMMEVLKSMRKLVAEGSKSSTSTGSGWEDSGSNSFGGGGDGSNRRDSMGGGRGRGGRGGGRGGGGGGGGGNCFKCNEPGHFSRECPQGGGDGGRRGGGRGGGRGFRSSYGGGRDNNGGGDDSWGDSRPNKRPRTSDSGGWDNGGGSTTAADDDWDTPSSNPPKSSSVKLTGGNSDDWAADDKKPPKTSSNDDEWGTESSSKPASTGPSGKPAGQDNMNKKATAPAPPKAAGKDESDDWE